MSRVVTVPAKCDFTIFWSDPPSVVPPKFVRVNTVTVVRRFWHRTLGQTFTRDARRVRRRINHAGSGLTVILPTQLDFQSAIIRTVAMGLPQIRLADVNIRSVTRCRARSRVTSRSALEIRRQCNQLRYWRPVVRAPRSSNHLLQYELTVWRE